MHLSRKNAKFQIVVRYIFILEKGIKTLESFFFNYMNTTDIYLTTKTL